jgi:ABC-type transport system involved in multi-copper enzyme maturation permease subunit
MSLRRLFAVFRRDLAHNLRRSLFWVWVLVLVLLSWAFSAGAASIQSGDSSVGGVKAHVTSEFAITKQIGILTTMVYGFFVAVAAGMAMIHDDECQVSELLHATPLRPGEYVWGKFLAVAATALIVLVIHLATMALCNHILPAGEARQLRGPFHLANYLKPALVFNVPSVVFMAGASFALGERTRTPVLVFFLPVAVLLGCAFFLWSWTPSWLDPRIDRALMLIDPAGFRWLNETWLKVDRGVTFYNNAAVPLDWLIIGNRLIVLGLGVGAVALSQRHFRAVLRGATRRAERAWTAGSSEPEVAAARAARPLVTLGMATRAPGLFRGAWAVARAEMTELRSSAGLYLFIPLLVLDSLGPTLIAVGPFDTPLLQTPGTFAARTLAPLSIMLCLLLLFYTVESLWRERRSGLASISLATPVRTGSLLLGKVLANGLIAVAVVVVEFAVAAGLLWYQGKVRLEWWPFLLVWGLLMVPTLWAWMAFVMATIAVTRNRYTTYAVSLAALIITGDRVLEDKISWVDNWPLLGAFDWSDISVLEFDRTALWLNRLLVVGLAVLLTGLAARFYPRRDFDASGLAQRLRPRPVLIGVLRLVPLALVPLVAGVVLWVKVDNGVQGKTTKSLEKDYWRKNVATYRDWPLPDITAVELDVTLDPAGGRLKVAGSYDLVNNQQKPLRQVPVSGGLHWENPRWTWDGQEIKPLDRSRLYVITPPEPIAPGATTRIGFAFEGAVPAGISRSGRGEWEFILPSAVVLHSMGTSFAPVLGFAEEIGVDDDNKYDSKEYADDFFEGQTDCIFGSRLPFRTHIKITGPADFTWNSVGTIASDVVEDGFRTTVWESDQPVNIFNIVGGRWAVRRGEGTAVYYHPAHVYNVAEIVEALDASRKYYSAWFRPFPWRELKLSEFPAVATYAMGFPTNIPFSEKVGFLTRSDPKIDLAFMVTAHEAAHQWWGNMVAPGKGPGSQPLGEGGADFSTLLLFEQVKGLHARITFSRKLEDEYAKRRQADSERPLVKTDGSRDGDQAVCYEKTAWVLWMLLNQMGRDRMLQGIQAFFESYHDNPDHPVLQDFLRVLRPFAADPAGFDAFTRQWFYEVVVPEYHLIDPTRAQEGASWKVTARLENSGTGSMPVEVAVVRGERFRSDGSAYPAYREARAAVAPQAGGSETFTIRCDFEPKQLVVDPDVKVLQLGRKAAVANF